MAKETEEAKHSPLPWRVGHANGCIEDSNGHMVADMGFYGLGKGEASGNAPFIVHCVNTHDKLVEACKHSIAIFRSFNMKQLCTVIEELEAALAEVKP